MLDRTLDNELRLPNLIGGPFGIAVADKWIDAIRAAARTIEVAPERALDPLLFPSRTDPERRRVHAPVCERAQGSEGRSRSARRVGLRISALEWRKFAMIRNLCDRASSWACAIGLLLGVTGMSLTGGAAEPTTAGTNQSTALKIGLLLDLSSGSEEVYRDRQRAFELAIKHVNEGGGVLGLPVTVAVGDATADPEKAVAAARHLVEVEGEHAIVGPNASASALPVAERVSGPAAIPTVSFSATSPALTAVADDDFLFRAALSDVSQGPVLAGVAREPGFDNVGLLHVDDAWGRGLAGAFEAAWDGPVKVVPGDRRETEFLTALRESASGGAQALVVIAFESAALAMVREAIDNGLYDNFVFGDGAKRPGLVRSLGRARLGNMYGPSPRRRRRVLPRQRGKRPASPSTACFRCSPTSRRPMTPQSPWRLRRRPRAGWTAPRSATGCARLAVRLAPSCTLAPRMLPMRFVFSPMAGKSTTKAPRAAWTGRERRSAARPYRHLALHRGRTDRGGPSSGVQRVESPEDRTVSNDCLVPEYALAPSMPRDF